ncbi:MAG: hypothetical protein CME45_07600 [Halieaceae bacterium]|nr:hypothetical protein [Halieaceae bacterium]
MTQQKNEPKPQRQRGDRDEGHIGVGLAALSWINFALLLAAVLKFIPLIYSYVQGVRLPPDQIAMGFAEERAWALDLISDTPYLLAVWFLAGKYLQWRTGKSRFVPWR